MSHMENRCALLTSTGGKIIKGEDKVRRGVVDVAANTGICPWHLTDCTGHRERTWPLTKRCHKHLIIRGYRSGEAVYTCPCCILVSHLAASEMRSRHCSPCFATNGCMASLMLPPPPLERPASSCFFLKTIYCRAQCHPVHAFTSNIGPSSHARHSGAPLLCFYKQYQGLHHTHATAGMCPVALINPPEWAPT
jgi:hypothetical protein